MKNKVTHTGQNNVMESCVKTDNILKDMCEIIEHSRKAAYQAVNTVLVQRNWLIGYRIAEEGFQGADRAEYGTGVIAELAKKLTSEYGKGFTKKRGTGTKRKHWSKHGVYARCREIFHPNIITGCFKRRKKNLLNRKCRI